MQNNSTTFFDENVNFESMTKDELVEYIRNLNESWTWKYGLIRDKEKHPEQIVVDCDKKIPVLKEISEKNINNWWEDNFLIEWDNFHALNVLNYTHHEAIDVIYIDPPYNTGNEDFMYNDKYIDVDDAYRHSKWLNFMSKRLKLARELLKDDWFIMISIDDNELFQLKLLCDKIFWSNNYINTIVIKTKAVSWASWGWEDIRMKKNYEFILLYSKKYDDVNLDIPKTRINLIDYIQEHKENNIWFYYTRIVTNYWEKKYIWSTTTWDWEEIKIYKHENFHFSSINQICKDTWLTDEEVYIKYFEDVFMVTNAQTSILSRVNNFVKKKNELISFEYIPKTWKDKWKITTKFIRNETLMVWLHDSAIKEDKVYKTEKIWTLWNNISRWRLDLEWWIKFKNWKKPVKLIKQILSMHINKNATVLDFFAWSWSTWHAVLDLNKEDWWHRKFILCTNNENNICEEVTYKRIKNVINWRWNIKWLDWSLKYFKTDFVANEWTKSQLYYDLTEKCIPMLHMKEDTFIQVESNNEYSIYTNENKSKYTCVYFDIIWEKYEEFKEKIKKIPENKSLYIFTLWNSIDEEELDWINNYSLEPIPQRIYEQYKKIVKMEKYQD